MQNREHFAGLLYIVEDPLKSLFDYFGIFFVMIEKFNKEWSFLCSNLILLERRRKDCFDCTMMKTMQISQIIELGRYFPYIHRLQPPVIQNFFEHQYQIFPCTGPGLGCNTIGPPTEIISWFWRIEDTAGNAIFWTVSVSVHYSAPKLQLEGHLQNHQGDWYKGPNALSPGDNLPRPGLSQHLGAKREDRALVKFLVKLYNQHKHSRHVL